MCFIILIAFFMPRLILAGLYFFYHVCFNVFQTWYWPLLGFLFMPYTTLAYMWAMYANGKIEGWYLVLLIVAILFDLSSNGGTTSKRRRS
jgi:hypothetical protein